MKTACPRCGANVTFMPATQKFYCEYCGMESDISEFHVEDLEEISPFAKYDECTCSSCGAKLIVGENTTITVCAYCGSHQIMKNRFQGEFRPDEILPFKIDQEEFIRIYRKFLKKRILAPDEFRKNSIITEIKGLYVPFQVFTLDSENYAYGLGEYRDKDTRYTMYFEMAFHMKVRSPQDASRKLNDDIMTSLEPFQFGEVTKFNPVYLNGFSSENGDEEIHDLEKKAWMRGSEEAYRKVNEKLGRYQFKGGKLQTKFDLVSRKYLLLPVWFFNTSYKGKTYSYALNGQTGKVVGQIPLSTPKFSIVMLISVITAINLTIGTLMLYAQDRHKSDDDGPGSIIAAIWMAVVGIYTYIKVKYRNVKKVLENPIERVSEEETIFQKYSKREFFKKFPNDSCELLVKKIKNEESEKKSIE